ncbi:MAG: hypothetical protein Q9182_004289 [Xanthomendoza sp. 2 TL-2023]
MTPEEQALSYIKSASELSETDAGRLFDSLQPLTSREFLVGSWDGGGFQTGHPGLKALKETKWAGKDFRGVDDVDPIMTFDDKGGRFWNEEWGHASLREMVYRGKSSVAMIYDTKPIFDHFRKVSEDIVMGAMDAPKLPVMGETTFYFYLKKRKEQK